LLAATGLSPVACTVSSTVTGGGGDGGSSGGDSATGGGQDSSSSNPDTSTSTGDDGGSSEAGLACPAIGSAARFAPAACDTCTRTNCCNEATACFGDTNCATLATCLSACNQPGADAGGDADATGFTPCEQACFGTDDAGTTAATEYQAVSTCQSNSCKNEC
jgi:hypothetical protein